MGMVFTISNIFEVAQVQYIYIFSVFAFPIIFSGMFMLFYNISTKNKMLKEQYKMEMIIREQKENLEASSRFANFGEMAAGVAHEINNPLAMIVLNNTLALKYLAKQELDIPKIGSLIKKNDDVVKRIAKIVSALKSLARNTENDPMEQTTLYDVVDDALEFCSGLLEPNDITFRVKYNGLETEFIFCRKVQISQVIVNLIGNSKDAIEMLEDRWIEVEAVKMGSSVFIHITDSGKGVPEEIQETIFTPMFTTKEVGKGTGLGLSLSKNFLLQHNGDLKYDKSYPNSRFTLEFKLKGHKTEKRIDEMAS